MVAWAYGVDIRFRFTIKLWNSHPIVILPSKKQKQKTLMTFEIIKGGKVALVFGASGLVGSQVLPRLLDHDAYDRVITFGRSDLDFVHDKLEHHTIDFDKIIDYAHLIKGDDLYCCVGTTRKKAGSKEAFRKVDFDYCVEIAQFAHVNQVSQLLMISTVGANPKSLFFYNQVKGELEQALQKLDFWALRILQPSYLLGLKEDEFHFADEAGKLVTKLMDNILEDKLLNYRPITAANVAQAMIKLAQGLDKGTHVYSSNEIRTLAEEEGLQRI